MNFLDFLLCHYTVIKKTEIKALSSICTHSTRVKKSSLFVALKGEKSNGHNHLKQAVQNGAGALLLENTNSIPPDFTGMVLKYKGNPNVSNILNEFYKFPSKKLFTIGVTGTNGKTSFCYLLEHLLQHCGWPTGLIGTVNQHFKKQKWPSTLTTPEPAELFERLNDFVQLGAKAVALEVSSHALEQKRISGIDFKALVFTNLSQDHLDYHGDIESYFQTKKKLFTSYTSKDTFCIINQDDEYGRRLKHEIQSLCWTYGQDEQADFCFQIKKQSQSGTEFILKSSFGTHELFIPIIGVHNVYNTVSALSCALLIGFKVEDCIKALEKIPIVPGRQEKIDTGQKLPFEIIIDYAHTPAALSSVLSALKPIAKKLIVVLGCGGDRDKGKRSQMADISLQFADRIVWTTDNPRFEKPENIVQEALAHLTAKQKERITVELDRVKAIQSAIQTAEPDDIVLISGKGHETFQIIKDQKVPFSDKELILKYVSKLPCSDINLLKNKN